MTPEYKDKNGNAITEGCVIHNTYDDSYEYVMAFIDDLGRDDLGVNGSNIDYLQRHPDTERLMYPLLAFDIENDLEVVPGTLEENLDKFTERQIRLFKFLHII